MPTRPSIPRLAAAAIAPLRVAPRFRSDLLRSEMTWIQDVNYLRDVYGDAHVLWEKLQAPEQDAALYEQTEPKLRELVLGLQDVAEQRPGRRDIWRSVWNARQDFEIASDHAKAGEFRLATTYQSYALIKLHGLLDALTAEANRMSKTGGLGDNRDYKTWERITRDRLKRHFERMKELMAQGMPKEEASAQAMREMSEGKLKRKKGYGYDISGEVFEQGGTSGQDDHLWDQGNNPKFDKTDPAPQNTVIDGEAEDEFPQLEAFKHKRVNWPARTR